MRAKYVIFLSVIISLFILVSCNTSSTSSTSPASQEGESEILSEEASSEGPEEPITLRLGHLMDTTNVWHITSENFKEEVESLSEGQITVDIFPNGQLGTESDMYQQLTTGNLDMMFSSLANLTGSYEEFSAWFIPYLFDDLDGAYQVGQSEEAKGILEVVESEGIIGLGYVLNGMRELNTTSPITNLTDYENRRIRVVPSPTIVDWYTRLGAEPVPMSFGEVYNALQTNLIEGVDNDLSSVLSGKHYEVAKHVTLTNHFAWAGAGLINGSLWESLNEEQRSVIQEAFSNMETFNLQLAKEQEAQDIAELEELGVEIHELEGLDEIRSLAQQMQQDYVSQNEMIGEFIERANSQLSL